MTTPAWTRRALLASGAAVLAGCAPTDPVIRPTGTVPPARRPQLDPVQAAALASETELVRLWQAIAAAAPGWPEAARLEPVAASKVKAHSGHVSRLRGLDVLLPDDEPFHPEPSTPVATVSGWADARSQVEALQASVAAEHRGAALASASSRPQLALFYGSLAACASASPDLALTGGASPRPFAVGTSEAVHAVLITRVWALVYALETGIGRLSRDAQLRPEGLARLAEVKLLRDELLARPELATPPRQRSDYDLGGPLGTEQEVLSCWSRAELALMGAWGRLAAVSPDNAEPLDAMLSQVRQAERWGRGLPAWPGWA